MTEAAERLKPELARLTPHERAELARFLIDSLDDELDNDTEAALDAELARRMAQIESGTATGEPADVVFAQLRAKFS